MLMQHTTVMDYLRDHVGWSGHGPNMGDHTHQHDFRTLFLNPTDCAHGFIGWFLPRDTQGMKISHNIHGAFVLVYFRAIFNMTQQRLWPCLDGASGDQHDGPMILFGPNDRIDIVLSVTEEKGVGPSCCNEIFTGLCKMTQKVAKKGAWPARHMEG